MKNLLLSFFLASCGVATAAPPTTNPLPIQAAIEKAVHQEMLTQCIAKSYLCVTLDLEKEQQQTTLQQSVQLFEYQLQLLQEQRYNRAIKEQLQEVEKLWKSYKFICEGNHTTNNALLVLEFNTQILGACHRVALLLKQHAKVSNAYGQEVAYVPTTPLGEQEQIVLMQRMLLYALANSYQLGSNDENKEEYATAMTDFLMLQEKGKLSAANDHANATAFEKQLTALVAEKEAAIAQQRLLPYISLADAFLYPLDQLLSQREDSSDE